MLLRMGNINGTVRIDGYPISELRLQTLRQAISVISQVSDIFPLNSLNKLKYFLVFLWSFMV